MIETSSISRLTSGSERPPAVVVAVQLPGVTDTELESSITELERLAKTLGLNPIARVVQRRGKLAPGVVVGAGKLVELAKWTGGTGEVPKYVRPGSKQAEAVAEAEDDAVTSDEPESDDPDDFGEAT